MNMDNTMVPGTFCCNAVIQHLEGLPVGKSFDFMCKNSSLQDEWTSAKAVKRESVFEIYQDGLDEQSKQIEFDDEKESIMSANLWEAGWFSITTNTHLQLVSKTAPSETCSFLFSGKKIALNSTIGKFTLHSVVKSSDNTFEYGSSVVTVRGKEDEVAIFYFGAELIDNSEAEKKENQAFIFNCTANEPQVVPLCDISLHHQHPELTADFDRDSCKERMKMFVRTFSDVPSIKINHNAVSDLVDLSLDQSPGSEKHTLSENNSSSGSVTPQDKTQTEKVAISNNSRKRKPPSPFSPEEVVGKRRPKLRPTDPRIPNSKQSKLFRENTPLKKNTTQHKGKVLSQPKSNKQSTQVEPSSSVNTQLVALMDQVGKLSSELAEMKTNQVHPSSATVPAATVAGNLQIQPSTVPAGIQFGNQPIQPNLQTFMTPQPMLLPQLQAPQTHVRESDTVQVARFMLASQYMGMMAPFFFPR